MAEGIQYQAEQIRSLSYSSTGATYVPIGTALVYPARIVLVQNLTDALMMFSIDGLVDNFVLPACSSFMVDITTNRVSSLDGLFLSAGQRLYVKRVGVPTTGTIYFSSFHGVR